MDAVHMLQQDHRKVEELFGKFLTGDEDLRQDVARQIFKELELHSTLEEELFYPALRNQGDLEELGTLEQGDREIDGKKMFDQSEIDKDEGEDEADEEEETGEEIGEDVIDSVYEDHQAVKELIGRLRSRGSDSPDFQAGMAELEELVMDHVEEKEEVLFAEAELKLDIKTLGRHMHDRKQDLVSSLSHNIPIKYPAHKTLWPAAHQGRIATLFVPIEVRLYERSSCSNNALSILGVPLGFPCVRFMIGLQHICTQFSYSNEAWQPKSLNHRSARPARLSSQILTNPSERWSSTSAAPASKR